MEYKKENVGKTDKKKMNFKRNIKESWTLIVSFVILTFVDILSILEIYKNDALLGIAYLLFAVTWSYTCIKGGKRLQKEGKEFGRYATILFVGGIFTAIWINRAFNLFFP